MLRYIVLGAVQGLTEFLPVSSSAHLLFLRHWLGMEEPGPLLVAFLHLGTLLALGVWFWRDLFGLTVAFTSRGKAARTYAGRLVLGLIPLAILAACLGVQLDHLFSSPKLAAALLFVTALLLLGGGRVQPGKKKVPGPGQALLIGLAQAGAVLPGISRSGATVTTGLLLGLEKGEAFRFSFLLGIPAFLGAALWTLRGGSAPESWGGLALGTLTAFLVGLLALRLFWAAVQRQRLWPLALYCLLLGIFGLIWG